MKSRHYKWAVVAMLWLVCLFNYADRQAFSAVFPKLKEEFKFDPVQLGLLGSAFAWVYAFGAPFAGWICDRIPRKHLILGGCLFWSAITMLTGWCGKFWQFATVRALTGVGETFYFPSAMSLLSDYHDRRSRSLAFSLHQSGVYIGTIGGSWAGALFAEYWGWRSGFWFFGAVGITLALVLYRFLREPPRGEADAVLDATDSHGVVLPGMEAPLGVAETLQRIFAKPTAVLLMLVFLGANFVATIFLTWTPTFLVDKFHLKLSSAGFSGSVFINLASAVSVPLGGMLADRLARRFPGGRVFVQAVGLTVGATFVAIVGLTSNVTTLLVAMTIFGLCKGLYDSNIFASLYDVIEPRARGTAAGLMNTVGWAGGALGPLAVGVATKYGRHTSEIHNMSEAIAFGSLIYLAGGIVLICVGVFFAKRDILRPVTVAA